MTYKKNNQDSFSFIFYLAAAVIFFIGFFFREDSPIFEYSGSKIIYYLKVAVLAASVGAIGEVVNWIEAKMEQRRRDRKANNRLKDFTNGLPFGYEELFCIYFRPFFTTGQLPIANPKKEYILPILPGYFRSRAEPSSFDLETILAEALEPIAPMIALGKPGEQIGAGRVASDEDHWKEDVVLLAKKARFIVCVPSDRPGTLWEIEMLQKEGLLDKCIFLMPSEPYFSEINLPVVWQQAQELLATKNVELPPYKSEGLLFRLGSDGKVTDRRNLNLDSRDVILRDFKHLGMKKHE